MKKTAALLCATRVWVLFGAGWISTLPTITSAKDGLFFSAKPPVSVKFKSSSYDGKPYIEIWNTSDSILHDITFSSSMDGERRSVVVLDVLKPHIGVPIRGSELNVLRDKLGVMGPWDKITVTCVDHSSPLVVDGWWESDLSALDNGQLNRPVPITLLPWFSMSFCYCPSGTFLMGSPSTETERDNDEEQVEVRISRGFWIGQFEVTQNQWFAVMNENPSLLQGGDIPIDGVSWEAANKFVQRLNMMLPQGARWQFALPTEAQWEYACRAGTLTPFSFGSVLTGSSANCNGEEPYGVNVKGTKSRGLFRGGSFSANAWGIFDMHGNVGEWCSDWYASKYEGGVDPTGPNTGSVRVWRGGTALLPAASCRSAFRPDPSVMQKLDVAFSTDPQLAEIKWMGWGVRLAVVRE